MRRPLLGRKLRPLALSLAALATFATTNACKQVTYGVEIDGRTIPVVDMHLHPGEWHGVPAATQAFLAGRFPFPFNTNPGDLADGILSAEGIIEELDKAGVHGALLYAVYAPRTVGVATNELVQGYLDDEPDRFWGLASLRVDQWRNAAQEELDALEAALGHPNMLGVKLAHAHMHFRMDDPAYFGIYELAGRLGKPVYLHTGTSPFPGTSRDAPYTDPVYIEGAIEAYPDTIFILGHLGFDFIEREHRGLEACIDLAQRFENVYLEPSALGSPGGDPDGEKLRTAMRRMREAGVVDRIIYGSDGPQGPGFVEEYLERTVEAMKDTGYTADEMEAVLSGNFLRVFKAELPEL